MSERGRPTRSAISYRPSWPSSPNLTAKSRSRRQPAGSPLSRAATSAAWPWVSNNARGLAMAASLAQGEQASKMLYYIRRWIGMSLGGVRIHKADRLARAGRLRRQGIPTFRAHLGSPILALFVFAQDGLAFALPTPGAEFGFPDLVGVCQIDL